MAFAPSNSNNVYKPKSGAAGYIFHAPKGSTVPTDASTPLDDEVFKAIGYLNAETGIVTAENREEGESTSALGGDIIDQDEGTYAPTLTFSMYELKRMDALEVYFPAADLKEDGGWVNSGNLPEDKMFVVEFVSKGEIVRDVYFDARCTSRGDRTIGQELTSLEVTYSLFKDNTQGALGAYDERFVAPVV